MMRALRSTARRSGALTLVAVGLLLTACAGGSPMGQSPWRFTTDGLEATTDAAAALADGSTKATKELLEPLRQMVSGMAPGGTGLVSERVKVVAFAVANHDRLRIDIARGGGEHLDAFARLIRVPADDRAGFVARLQGRYESIYGGDRSAVASLDRLLVEHYDPQWKVALRENPS